MSMGPTRWREAQDDGAFTRQQRDDLKRDGLPLEEALRILAETHTNGDAGALRVTWSLPPDFTKVDGDRYKAAWRAVLEHLAKTDSGRS